MDDSFFPGSRPGAASGAVTGSDLAPDGGLVPAAAEVRTVPSSGGLWSTAADLVCFGLGWASLLPADLAGEALTPHAERPFGAVGLRWFLDRTGETAGLSGVGPGVSASLVVRMGDRCAQVALSKCQAPVASVAACQARSRDTHIPAA